MKVFPILLLLVLSIGVHVVTISLELICVLMENTFIV
jgi:hypothetical protein